jgi:hypothetical protein
VASSAMRPGVHAFDAQFVDTPCKEGRFCGTGTLAGFGTVKTQVAVGPPLAGPATGCFGIAGTRMLTLASDPKSTLRLSFKGDNCGSRFWGTFKVASGSGVFARATGSGVDIGTFSMTHRESVRFWGVLTLAGK